MNNSKVCPAPIASPERVPARPLSDKRKSRPLVLVFFLLLWGCVIFGNALLFPNRPAENAARKVEDRAAAVIIGAALEQYLREVGGRFPAVTAGTPVEGGGGDTDTDTSGGAGLVTALLGGGPEARRDFLAGFKKAKAAPDTSSRWANGLVSAPPPTGDSVYDHQGRAFRVRLDTGGDGCVPHPRPPFGPVEPGRERPVLQKRVAVWTAGLDGDWNTWEDNAGSWE